MGVGVAVGVGMGVGIGVGTGVAVALGVGVFVGVGGDDVETGAFKRLGAFSQAPSSKPPIARNGAFECWNNLTKGAAV